MNSNLLSPPHIDVFERVDRIERAAPLMYVALRAIREAVLDAQANGGIDGALFAFPGSTLTVAELIDDTLAGIEPKPALQ